MSFEIRTLTQDDAEAARTLNHEAFGVPQVTPKKKKATLETEGRTNLGVFDGTRLVGRVVGLDHESAFGGRFMPSLGISAVSMVNEARGGGVLRDLFVQILSQARAHGVALSTLYPSASAIYRGIGYEVIADNNSGVVPTASLARVRAADDISLRRAELADVEAITELYQGWAIEQNGPLAHRGPLFSQSPKKWLKQFTGVTLAEDADGALQGYLAWGRGPWQDKEISVTQFHWRTGDAARSLLAMLASNSSVTDTIRFLSSGRDPLRLLLPSSAWKVDSRMPYMARLVDLRAAFQTRVWPQGLDVELPFRLEGDLLEANNGDWKLRIEDGEGLLTRIGRSGSHSKRSQPLELGPRGLAVVHAGAQSVATLRAAGLVSGGDPAMDAAWSLAFGGRQTHIRDFF